MPSETIHGNMGEVDVRVAWGSNQSGEVQVATLMAGTSPGPTERLIGIVNEWLKEAGEPTIDLAKLREHLPYTPDFDGWHASLGNWSAVNRLIKVLKRARDQAFGVPE